MARRSIYVFLLCIVVCVAFHNDGDDSVALERFFEEMDDNHDGKVDESEAKKYIGERIGGQEYDTAGELTEAFRQMVSNIDRDPAYHNTITVAEFQDHLINLQHASVKEWVRHGLGLPQYAEKFKQNVISAADFPLLIEDDGRILKEELQITSRLHRNQIVRGMKRLILGLGEQPSAPQVIGCRQDSETRTTLQWSSPSHLGVPPVHKYLLETLDVDSPDGTAWIVAKEIEAHNDRLQYVETIEHDESRYLFRIVAWTAYGPSPYVLFSDPQQHPTSASNLQSITDNRLRLDKVANFDPIRSKVPTINVVQQQESNKAGYWSLFVVAVTIALRVLTTRNVALLKCCFLWKLEKMALWMGMSRLAERVSNVARRECPRCKERCNKKHADTESASSHPSLIQAHAQSHKIEAVQHFPIDDARMVLSKSSPALGDSKTEYPTTEWDPIEAAESLSRLPIPDYNVTSWDGSEASLSSFYSKNSSASNESRLSTEVHSDLIEGQCAYEGYVIKQIESRLLSILFVRVLEMCLVSGIIGCLGGAH